MKYARLALERFDESISLARRRKSNSDGMLLASLLIKSGNFELELLEIQASGVSNKSRSL